MWVNNNVCLIPLYLSQAVNKSEFFYVQFFNVKESIAFWEVSLFIWKKLSMHFDLFQFPLIG